MASEVSGIVTQGRGDIPEWVTHFMVSYSLDAYKWEFARDIYGTKKVCVVSKVTCTGASLGFEDCGCKFQL